MTDTNRNHHSSHCFVAREAEALDQVFALRYACYRRKASIEPRADERFSDHYDQLPNSFSFLVQADDGKALATVRISVVRQDLDWRESPVQHVYGDHPTFQDIAGESYVEASRLCFARQARRDSFVRLVGHMAALADFYEVKWLVACPRVEHAETYQRMFGFRPLAAPRKYFGVSFETQLLGVRREELQAYVRDAQPMTSAWSSALRYLGTSLAAPLAQPC